MINTNMYGYNAPTMPTAPVVTQSSMPQWVQGETAAKAYLVPPNSSVLLMDSEKETFYIKSTDASGMPLPLRIFDYKERTAPTQAPQEAFITREEFEKRLAELTPKGKKAKDDE